VFGVNNTARSFFESRTKTAGGMFRRLPCCLWSAEQKGRTIFCRLVVSQTSAGLSSLPHSTRNTLGGAGIEPATPGFSVLGSREKHHRTAVHADRLFSSKAAMITVVWTPATVHLLTRKVKIMAAILSLFWPGLGQLILGKPFFGLLLFVLAVVGYFAFVVPGLLVHAYAIYHAHQLGRKQQIADIAAAMQKGSR